MSKETLGDLLTALHTAVETVQVNWLERVMCPYTRPNSIAGWLLHKRPFCYWWKTIVCIAQKCKCLMIVRAFYQPVRVKIKRWLRKIAAVRKLITVGDIWDCANLTLCTAFWWHWNACNIDTTISLTKLHKMHVKPASGCTYSRSSSHQMASVFRFH